MVRNASPGVIGINRRNPHYFEYKGRDILLLTSAEHYAAVFNKAFDYKAYLDALHRNGLNYTRIYPGTKLLPNDINRKNDTMNAGANFIAPWARSGEPGYVGGGNKFDLNRWDEGFFGRLRDFTARAYELDIIVELCFFNDQYDTTFPHCPLHAGANIQGVGGTECTAFTTLANAVLVAEQKKLIEKLMRETNGFDNVIYEFIDEPTLYGTKSADAYNWISALIDHAIAVEAGLPKKHMLAQQMMFGVDFSDDDRVSLLVAQYVSEGGRQVGSWAALANSYKFNKPIETNETVSVLSEPNYYERDVVDSSRIEMWEFMLGGGAGFNQLNAGFTVLNPSGADPINDEVFRGIRNLRRFLESMDYVKMTRDSRTVREMSVGGRISGIYEAGKQYVIYIHHCFTNFSRWRETHYLPNYGAYEPVLTVNLEPGSYDMTFINPADLTEIAARRIDSGGGDMKIECPRYKLDLPIKIVATHGCQTGS